MRLKSLLIFSTSLMIVWLQGCRESSITPAASQHGAPSSQQGPSIGKELPPVPSVTDTRSASAEDGEPAQEKRSKRRRPKSGDRNAPRGEAGDFDFYVLSLSWSPQHCATPAGQHDRDQCSGMKQFNFVVHGLWPQYDPRGWPQSCRGDPQVNGRWITEMLPLMPSPKLIRHEWEKHGTCSGLGQDGYFAKIKQARAKVNVPADFQSPRDAIRTSPSIVKSKFVAANPGMPTASMGAICGGRFLQEIDVCLTKDLNIRNCPSGVRDTCPDELIIQPVR